jgi:hypothetical protein
MRNQNRIRQARFASVIWSVRKEEWQLRLGNNLIVYRSKDYSWMLTWSRWYSEKEDIPLRIIYPNYVPIQLEVSVYDEENKYEAL